MFVGVKMDEDLSRLVAQPLIDRGYNVATVIEQGWSGFKDPDLWPRVQAERRMLVTADKGFGDIRVCPPGTHAGIIVLRPDRDSIVDHARLVESLADRHRLHGLTGCLVVVSPRSIRIRR